MDSSPGHPTPASTDLRAADDLRFIRQTMERAGSFTAVPGWGMFAIGLTALGAAFLASRQTGDAAWLLVWLVEAALASLIGVAAMARKAQALKVPLLRGSGVRFLFGLCPPLVAGALLTVAFLRLDLVRSLPGTWLLLYGTGVVTGGAFSIGLVRLMGLCFMGLGTVALFVVDVHADLWMAVGFGGFNLLFGAIVARRYGG